MQESLDSTLATKNPQLRKEGRKTVGKLCTVIEGDPAEVQI